MKEALNTEKRIHEETSKQREEQIFVLTQNIKDCQSQFNDLKVQEDSRKNVEKGRL